LTYQTRLLSRKRSSSVTSKIVELFGVPTTKRGTNWRAIVNSQTCPYTGHKCIKVRKSDPDVSIGTCTVTHSNKPIIICPIRLRDRHQIFLDCMHLLTLHEPGNEVHAIPEIAIPGGSLDFVLVSAREGNVKDFVGIELQTLDSTGTVWPERQRFIKSVRLPAEHKDLDSAKPFGMNWKMTAKTILMQLHHKVETLEHLGKRLVLIVQDHLLDYMTREFSFAHLANPARLGDPMHFHSYSLIQAPASNRLDLFGRRSTDVAGIAMALGLQVSAHVDMDVIVAALEAKMSIKTRLMIGPK